MAMSEFHNRIEFHEPLLTVNHLKRVAQLEDLNDCLTTYMNTTAERELTFDNSEGNSFYEAFTKFAKYHTSVELVFKYADDFEEVAKNAKIYIDKTTFMDGMGYLFTNIIYSKAESVNITIKMREEEDCYVLEIIHEDLIIPYYKEVITRVEEAKVIHHWFNRVDFTIEYTNDLNDRVSIQYLKHNAILQYGVVNSKKDVTKNADVKNTCYIIKLYK